MLFDNELERQELPGTGPELAALPYRWGRRDQGSEPPVLIKLYVVINFCRQTPSLCSVNISYCCAAAGPISS